MNWVESLLIIGGVSLDVFATMECQGSVVAKIEKKGLFSVCLLVSAWQAAALYAGGFLSAVLVGKDRVAGNEAFIGNGIAMVIFAGLGAHLVAKALRSEGIAEHREDGFNRKKILRAMAGTGVYTLLAGIAFGLVGANVGLCLGLVVCLSMVVVVAGVYTGYHLGVEQRWKAYGVGAAFMWIIGADILLRYVLRVL